MNQDFEIVILRTLCLYLDSPIGISPMAVNDTEAIFPDSITRINKSRGEWEGVS